MNREDLLKRIEQLSAEREQIINESAALDQQRELLVQQGQLRSGAIRECQLWLTRMETAAAAASGAPAPKAGPRAPVLPLRSAAAPPGAPPAGEPPAPPAD